MWLNNEDGQRYQELTTALQSTVREHCARNAQQPVTAEDLCLYLEWFELAREGASSIRPFIDRGSPYMLRSVSYQQLARDFQWLTSQVQAAQPSVGF